MHYNNCNVSHNPPLPGSATVTSFRRRKKPPWTAMPSFQCLPLPATDATSGSSIKRGEFPGFCVPQVPQIHLPCAGFMLLAIGKNYCFMVDLHFNICNGTTTIIKTPNYCHISHFNFSTSLSLLIPANKFAIKYKHSDHSISESMVPYVPPLAITRFFTWYHKNGKHLIDIELKC